MPVVLPRDHGPRPLQTVPANFHLSSRRTRPFPMALKARDSPRQRGNWEGKLGGEAPLPTRSLLQLRLL